VPILAAVAVTVGVVAVAFTIGSHGHHVGGSNSATSGSTRPPSSAASPASAPPGGIRGQVLTSNELQGFQSAGVNVYPGLQSWLAAEQQTTPASATAEKAMLMRAGFREGATENLVKGITTGSSIVERFRSPQAARDALAFYVQRLKSDSAGAFQSFSIPGIPEAQGLAYQQYSGVNIAFTNGPYYYLVDEAASGATTIAALKAAALHLYHRLHH
jgi:hypothetical protein